MENEFYVCTRSTDLYRPKEWAAEFESCPGSVSRERCLQYVDRHNHTEYRNGLMQAKASGSGGYGYRYSTAAL